MPMAEQGQAVPGDSGQLPWKGESILHRELGVRPSGRGTVVVWMGRRDVVLSIETALDMAAALIASATRKQEEESEGK